MTESADLLAKADETRLLADGARSETIRWQLVGLAKQFERLAEQVEFGNRARSQSAETSSGQGAALEESAASAFMLGVGP
ncbi:MAG: hypothetical protein WDO24_20550 [Pseudomonadota bacterium]